MRTTHRCPKCEHAEVLHVPEPRDTGHDRMALGSLLSPWTGGVNAGLEAYVCMKCGYTELYVARLDQIRLDKMGDARVLRPDDSGAPYR